MRKSLFSLALLISLSSFAQTGFEVSKDPKNGEKTLKGLISRDILQSDTAFHWYAENLSGYKPYQKAVDGLQKLKDSVQFIVFMGTWCEDSHFVVPKFFALAGQTGVAADHITLFGVDRQKNSVGQLSQALGITNVPTIIVLKDGRELGRIVEYGKTGLFDMDLAQILEGSAH